MPIHASSCPHSTMVGGLEYETLPVLLPVASMAFTTFMDSSSLTLPKTTCLPSSQLVAIVVMKNCEPLLVEQLARVHPRDMSCRNRRVDTGVGHGQLPRLFML